jgi:DNA polymerase
MYHPAAGLHQASLKDVIRNDFKKIPLVIAEAERMASEAPPRMPEPLKAKEEPPQQLSLF